VGRYTVRRREGGKEGKKVWGKGKTAGRKERGKMRGDMGRRER
jgi:hypothetical protein